ncbi:MAG: restriction endonuclease subunit S [Pseudomonadota bacterium]
MKVGWKTYHLGDVCTLQRGFDLPKKNRLSGQTPLMSSSGVIDFHNEAKVIGPGVVTGRSGSIGSVFYIDGDFWPLNTTLYVKDFHGNHPRFIYHLLSNFNLKRFSTGAGVPTLNRNNIHCETVNIPKNVEEQKLIAAFIDESFTGIDAAITNTEKNLANTQELFESHLYSAFNSAYLTNKVITLSELASDIIDGDHMPPPKSTKGIPFITIKNINKKTKEIDFENAFRVSHEYFGSLKNNRKPVKGDILYTVTGSFGIPVMINNNMLFCFQRHIGLVRPKSFVNNKWMYYLLLSQQVKSQAIEKATGTAQKTVSLKALRGFLIPKVSTTEQYAVATKLDEIAAETCRLESIYQHKITALKELKQSLLQKAFSGDLTANNVIEITSERQSKTAIETNSPAFAAHIMAAAFHWHASQSREKTFGRVKAQKTLHLVESLADIDLGRHPIKDAAGPNDSQHMRAAEDWARDHGFFEFVQRSKGQRGYDFRKGTRYEELVAEAMETLRPYENVLKRVVKLLMPLNTAETEILATVYAAWNNLILGGIEPTENAIIHEARENWHADKLKYSEKQFLNAISQIRQDGLVPQGRGKRVTGQESLAL